MNAGGRLGEIGAVVQLCSAFLSKASTSIVRATLALATRNSKFPKETVLTFAKLRCEKLIEPWQRAQSKSKRARKYAENRRSRSNDRRLHVQNPQGDFAGRLIEAAGLKGTRIGDAQISDVHANFIINLAKLQPRMFFSLSKLARETVLTQSGVLLEYEVRLINL